MSSIGSGPVSEVGATRPVSAPVQSNPGAAGTPASATAPVANTTTATAEPMVSSTALSPGSAPVDQDRVTQIRKAIETGTYPIIPTKISDAMIAAGLSLRIRK